VLAVGGAAGFCTAEHGCKLKDGFFAWAGKAAMARQLMDKAIAGRFLKCMLRLQEWRGYYVSRFERPASDDFLIAMPEQACDHDVRHKVRCPFG
jgi:hypothetical protein